MPSASIAQSGGMDSPRRAAAMMLPRATTEVARSILTGNPLPVGKEAPIGLVPKKGSLAPKGGMAGSALVVAMRTVPRSAAWLQ